MFRCAILRKRAGAPAADRRGPMTLTNAQQHEIEQDKDLRWVLDSEPDNDHRRAANRELSSRRQSIRYLNEAIAYSEGRTVERYPRETDDEFAARKLRTKQSDEAVWVRIERMAVEIDAIVAQRKVWGPRTREQRNEEFARKAERQKLIKARRAAYKAAYEAQAAVLAHDAEHGRFRWKTRNEEIRARQDAGCCRQNVNWQVWNEYHEENPEQDWSPHHGGEHSADCNQA